MRDLFLFAGPNSAKNDHEFLVNHLMVDTEWTMYPASSGMDYQLIFVVPEFLPCQYLSSDTFQPHPIYN